MDAIDNILVAVPSEPKYYPVVQYAIGMAHDLSASLTVGFTYHFAPAHIGSHEEEVAYERAYAKASFERIKHQAKHGGLADFHLISADGPLCKAILAMVPTYHPQLIITAADPLLPTAQLVQELSHPLLLVPLGAVYHPPKRIALTYDTKPLRTYEPIMFVNRIAQTYRATVEVVEFDTAKHLASPTTNQINVTLGNLLSKIPHRYHQAIGEGTVEDMQHYVDHYHPQWLIVLSRPSLPYDTPPAKRHAVMMVALATVPLLVLKS